MPCHAMLGVVGRGGGGGGGGGGVARPPCPNGRTTSGETRENGPLEFGHDERLGAVLRDQDGIKVVGDLGGYALEDGVAQRPDVGGSVAVVILAVEDVGVVGVRLGDARDVDEQAVARVDPARVDDVHAVAAHALPDPRVDV